MDDPFLEIERRNARISRLRQIAELSFIDFPLDSPLLGATRVPDEAIANNFEHAVTDPTNKLITLDEGEITGFALLVDVSKMDWLRADESGAAYYLYFMAVHPEARGRGRGRLLMNAVLQWAKSRGVTYLEMDLPTTIPEGHERSFADAVQQWYGDAITAAVNHADYPSYGPQRFMIVDVDWADHDHN